MKCKIKKMVFISIYIFSLFIITECALRIVLTIRHGVSFWDPAEILIKRYPELETLPDPTSNKDASFEILLLGGSVLHEDYGTIAPELESFLHEAGHTNVQVFNAAQCSHTSRDSYLKHSLLDRQRFDCIVIYHGINDLTANNCPPEIFRNNYNHFAWYEQLNVLDRHTSFMHISVIPYAFDYIYHRIKQLLKKGQYVPVHNPREDWLHFADDIKTAKPFQTHYEGIIQQAEDREERVIVASFAYYLPTNYTRALFYDKKLSYVGHKHAVKLWGRPDNVLKGLEQHNEISMQLAQDYSNAGVLFFDMKNTIPEEGIFYDDICHLSPAGCTLYAKSLASYICTTLLTNKSASQQ